MRNAALDLGLNGQIVKTRRNKEKERWVDQLNMH